MREQLSRLLQELVSQALVMIADESLVEACLYGEWEQAETGGSGAVVVRSIGLSSSFAGQADYPMRFDLDKWPELGLVAQGARRHWGVHEDADLEKLPSGRMNIRDIAVTPTGLRELPGVLVLCNSLRKRSQGYDSEQLDHAGRLFRGQLYRPAVHEREYLRAIGSGSRPRIQFCSEALLRDKYLLDCQETVIDAEADPILAAFIDMGASLVQIPDKYSGDYAFDVTSRDSRTLVLRAGDSTYTADCGDRAPLSCLASIRWEIAGLGGRLPIDGTSEDGVWVKYSRHLDAIEDAETRDPHLEHECLRTEWMLINVMAERYLRSPADVGIEDLVSRCTQPRDGRMAVAEGTARLLWHGLSAGPTSEILITSDWLLRWFAGILLEGSRLHKRLSGDEMLRLRVDPRGSAEYLYQLSACVLHVLHLMKWTSCDQTPCRIPRFADLGRNSDWLADRAFMFLVCDYAHEECGVDRELAFVDCLSELLAQEPILYAMDEKHRDHLYHVLDVCLLGLLLLDTHVPAGFAGAKFRDALVSVNPALEPNINGLWVTAALYHDVGFTIAMASRLLDVTETIDSPEISLWRKKVEDCLLSAKGVLAAKAQAADPLNLPSPDGYVEMAYDHGVASWLYLEHIVGTTVDPGRWALALDAVIRHNIKDVDIDCSKNPLAFLLLLCDHLQEWGRPRVGRDDLATGMVVALRHEMSVEFERKSAAQGVLMSLVVDAENRRIGIAGHDGLDLVIMHGTSEPEDAIEPAVYWITNCFELQRLALPDDWPTVTLSMVNELSETMVGHSLSLTEVGLLSDFLREEREGAPLGVFVKECVATPDSGPIGYAKTEDNGRHIEKLTLRLNLLANAKPVRRIPDKFYQKFREFKLRKLTEYGVLSNPIELLWKTRLGGLRKV